MAHWHRLTEIHRHLNATQHHCRCKQFVQHGTTKHENKPLSKLSVAYKWYRLFIVCFPSTINHFQDLMLGVFARDLKYMYYECHVWPARTSKKVMRNVTAFFPPGDQTVKYKFSPGAKYGKQHSESGVNSGSVGDGKQDIFNASNRHVFIFLFLLRNCSFEISQNSCQADEC